MNLRRFSDNSSAVHAIANELRMFTEQTDKPIWLMSGGSNVPVQVQVCRQLSADHKKKLKVGLVDERYGEGSNFSQLKQQGFDFGSFGSVYEISANGKTLKEAAQNFDAHVRSVMEDHKFFIELGFGSDGHVAGLKPEQNRVSVEFESGLVIGYQADDFQRISLQLAPILNASRIVLFASGDRKIEKFEAVSQSSESNPLSEVLKLEATQVYLSEGA